MHEFPADGKSGGTVRIKLHGNASLRGPLGDTAAIRVTAREDEDGVMVIYFASTGKPGVVRFETSDGAFLRLTFLKSGGDVDDDGFPDEAELNTEEDRMSFRRWFVRIAESQFLKSGRSWNSHERDCAGLIRYAYREALKRHDDTWHRRNAIIIDKNLPDIRKFTYPDVPRIGMRIFKVKEGPYGDLSTFGSFADVSALARLNCVFITRDLSDALPGDILFFRFEENMNAAYHSMIVTRDEKGSIALVYHTGTADMIKRVDPLYLAGSIYEVSPGNPRFLGVYRFHILE
jgi:uncharacterized protein YfaT (DUF1175 family)